MSLKTGSELRYLTEAHLVGYQLNNGNLSSMTPLQKIATRIIIAEIIKWKMDNKPLPVI